MFDRDLGTLFEEAAALPGGEPEPYIVHRCCRRLSRELCLMTGIHHGSHRLGLVTLADHDNDVALDADEPSGFSNTTVAIGPMEIRRNRLSSITSARNDSRSRPYARWSAMSSSVSDLPITRPLAG